MPAVVGLNGVWLCLECYEKAMAQIGKQIGTIKRLMIGEKECGGGDELEM